MGAASELPRRAGLGLGLGAQLLQQAWVSKRLPCVMAENQALSFHKSSAGSLLLT